MNLDNKMPSNAQASSQEAFSCNVELFKSSLHNQGVDDQSLLTMFQNIYNGYSDPSCIKPFEEASRLFRQSRSKLFGVFAEGLIGQHHAPKAQELIIEAIDADEEDVNRALSQLKELDIPPCFKVILHNYVALLRGKRDLEDLLDDGHWILEQADLLTRPTKYQA